MNTIRGSFYSKTDIGKVRVVNEDQAVSLINAKGQVLLCVCDGLGGHSHGDYASNLAIQTITSSFNDKNGFRSWRTAKIWMKSIISFVAKEIYKEAAKQNLYKNMATTIVLALLINDKILVLSSGDSRAYFVKKSALEQITEDQTYVEYLYNTGSISEEDKKTHSERHVLTNALGIYPSASFELKVFDNNRDPILLCSDGLYNNMTDTEIHSVLTTNDRVDQKINSLISVANNNGGSDNIAISYWECSK